MGSITEENIWRESECCAQSPNTDSLLNVPLYPGSSVTLLEAVVKYLLWFSEHPHVSKTAVSDILVMQHLEILPEGNVLPTSYNDALKLIQPYLIKPMTSLLPK